MLRLLARLRVDVDAPNFAGKTPAHFAAERGHAAVLAALRALGVDTEAEFGSSVEDPRAVAHARSSVGFF